jgi:glycosyltransferase involved in cell wall biosynthesis
MKSVSCVIPAYNEAVRIGGVLQAVIGHPLVSEIVVVDDGSSDGTRDIVAQYPKVSLVALPKNGGKSAAVAEGIRRARGELIFLLDADLAGLSPGDITRIIEPVQSGAADLSISLRRNTPGTWRLIGLDYLSGERVFSKEFIEPMLGGISALHGFGLEVYMNKSIIRHRLRVAVVWWGDVHSAFKHHKPGSWWLLGINKDYIRMGLLVMRTITPWEAVYQVFSMRRLRV